MRSAGRKSTPKVKDGKVQKKNRQSLSPDIYEHDFEELAIIRERPLKGYYHAVSPSDIRRWIKRIPDWEQVSVGLKAVVLTSGGDHFFGRYNNAGVLKLDAWPKAERQPVPRRKSWIVEQLGHPAIRAEEAFMNFTPDQARAFLLLGTFLHELGHHHDRMSTRSRLDASNGEHFAVQYELRRQRELWQAFVDEFGEPG